MKLKLLAVLILVALQLSCSAPAVNRVVLTAGNCMTWDTDQPARCRVIYCMDGMCNSGLWESDYKMAHRTILPPNYGAVKIMSLNLFNQMSECEVRP